MNDPHTASRTPICRRRFDAALAYQRRSFARFTADLGQWSQRHLQFVVDGERKGSATLLAAVQRELGESAWLYATGQTDRLADDGEGDVAA